MEVVNGYRDRWRSSTLRLSPVIIDIAAITGSVSATIAMLLWNYHNLPLQYWDESRNANNALEMMLGSSWLVPVYDGQPDHWNTKPPLLIWVMAGLMKLGLPPLLAVRLPSAIAACLTVALLWVALRFGLRDRLAATVAVVLLLSSKLYTGVHGAHTGDYDALLALFTTGYVLCVWQALTSASGEKNTKWIAGAGIFIVAAVMTKGPAGIFGLIGLGLFSLITGQLLRVVNDWRWWLTATVACAICASYYLTRELYDPGYLEAVWVNEISGRYGETNEQHYEGRLFYFATLFKQFFPGAILLLFVGISLSSAEVKRKRLAQIGFLSGLGIVIILSTAQTQLHWYLIPAIPLLSIAAAIAVVDAIRRFRPRPAVVAVFYIFFLATPLIASVYKNAYSLPTKALQKVRISQYGLLFDQLYADKRIQQLTVVDDGVDNTAGLVNYNPELKFYALLEEQKGHIIVRENSHRLPTLKGLIATCDYKNTALLRATLDRVWMDNNVCVAGYVD